MNTVLCDQGTIGRERRIRVLHVVDSLRVGGLENGVVNLVNALDEKVFQSSICCLRTTGGLQKRLRDPGIKVFELHQKVKDNLFPRMRRILTDESIDIVHSNGYGTFFDSVVGAQLARTPFIVHCIHGIYWRDMGKMKMRRRIMQRLLSLRTHKLYAVADFLREYYIHVVGVPARRIDTIYNGVDIEAYAPIDQNARRDEKVKLGFPAGQILIGAVGTLYWVKDPQIFLKAASLVVRERDDVSFVWVGDGPLRDQLHKVARELNLEGKLTFLGSRDDVPRILAALDVFVLPSLIEGFSYSILEAMASGLPVVATDVGGNAELIQDGVSGYLMPTKKPRLLADILLRLASDESLRTQLGQRARQRVEENFSLQGMVQTYQQMYLAGLRGRKSAPRNLPSCALHGVN
jgi:sugar transferase (PEP-CTERM/EpsH1 system associated)